MPSSPALSSDRRTPSRRVARACVMTHGRPETVGDGLARLQQVAAEHGVELIFPEIERRKHSLHGAACRWSIGDGSGADLAVVLGGDGTTLRALQRFLGTSTPVFAVNYGRVGFLTTAGAHDLETAVGRAFRGDFNVIDLPTVDVRRDGQLIARAVNDAVVTSALHGRMALFSWSVNGVHLGEIGCDAMVVSTPSGSTAYSLSAGGPVMGWGLDGVSVTFVAPHSLSVRSLVVPRGDVIEIVNRGDDVQARIVVDGQVAAGALEPGEPVAISMADERAHLATLPEVSFLQRFRDTF
jgi:NAD+ kinase